MRFDIAAFTCEAIRLRRLSAASEAYILKDNWTGNEIGRNWGLTDNWTANEIIAASRSQIIGEFTWCKKI